ncbi:hypothetical protein AVEN_7935-1 [Araneus ventricosus]|uniref:Uncharacterized protein n=1 Tax=Araneus ventricosus TaxID=182803 RepID=A0A4Y2D3V3_ARAVE|nr:hypothetical protein AVEN_7935-1 [Araneus ventricosus]
MIRQRVKRHGCANTPSYFIHHQEESIEVIMTCYTCVIREKTTMRLAMHVRSTPRKFDPSCQNQSSVWNTGQNWRCVKRKVGCSTCRIWTDGP